MDDVWKDVLDEKFDSTAYAREQLALIRHTTSYAQDVLSAIEELKTSPNVSTRTLEKVIEVERHPKLIKQMRSLGIIPPCMVLVRKCHERGQLFNSKYGYLSLRVLFLSLEVSILMHLSRYAITSEAGQWTNSLREDVARGLSTKIAAVSGLKVPFLRWEPSGSGDPEIFSYAGGLSTSDTRFLLDVLFDQRQAVLQVCLNAGIPGLSTALVILWQFALSQRDSSLWELVDVLERRNYIVSPNVDRPIVQALFRPFSEELTPTKRLSVCVDHDDSLNLLEAFRRNVRLVAPDDAVDLLVWLTGAVNDNKKEKIYASALINVTRDLAVALIEGHRYSPDARIFTIQTGLVLLTSVGNSFKGMEKIDMMSPKATEIIAETSQAIGISGQVYLLVLKTKLDHLAGHFNQGTELSFSYQQELLALDNLVEQIRIMASYARLARIDSAASLSTLSLAHLDWSRILIHIEFLFASLDIKIHVYKQYHEPWIQVGRAFKFKFGSTHTCAFSRCPDPRLIPEATLLMCDRCQVEYYCSHACQRRDWSLDLPTSHRARCSMA